MSGRKKTAGKEYGAAVYIVKGLVVGLAAVLLLSLLGALLIVDGKIGENRITLVGICITFISAFVGARMALKEGWEKPWMICAVYAICFFASLLVITALVFGGEYQATGRGCVTCAVGAFLSLVRCTKKRSTRRSKRRVR